MEEKYTIIDRIKAFSLRHRTIVVLLLTAIVMTALGVGVTYSIYKNKPTTKEFDEIQIQIDKIEKHDANIINTLEVEEISKTTKGIDVSGWQGNINWEKVKAAGIEFAMIRIGTRKLVSGEIVEDSYFEQNIKGANAADVPVGVYFYSTAKNELEVLEEATFVLNKIKDYKITYPVAYDLEAFGENRLKNVSDERINYNALIFLNYFKSHGYQGMLYGNKTALTTHWNLNRFENYKIWFAHYIDETDYEGRYDMWQYTDAGEVDGIYGYLDLNIANFAYQEVSKTIDESIPSSEIQPGPEQNPVVEEQPPKEDTPEQPSNFSDKF